jgi:multimeric flavodoxin WrbA
MSPKRSRVVVLFGSPRQKGNTAVLADWFEKAASKKGAKVQRFDLYKMKVQGCAHCDHCKQFKKTPSCALQDDFGQVLSALVRAQTIVVASPVYCWSVSGCMSAALDRFYCLFKRSAGSLLKGKKVVGMFTSGGDAFDGMDLCVDMIKRICDYGKAEYVGTLSGINCTNPKELGQRQELKKEVEELTAILITGTHLIS